MWEAGEGRESFQGLAFLNVCSHSAPPGVIDLGGVPQIDLECQLSGSKATGMWVFLIQWGEMMRWSGCPRSVTLAKNLGQITSFDTAAPLALVKEQGKGGMMQKCLAIRPSKGALGSSQHCQLVSVPCFMPNWIRAAIAKQSC